MFVERELRNTAVVGSILLAAALSGALLAESTARGLLVVGALAFVALAIVAFETPIAVFCGLALLLGVASEEVRDDRLLGIREVVFGPIVSIVSLPVLLLGLLAVVLALSLSPDVRAWPGAPATLAVALFAVGLANAVWFGPIEEGLFVVRPLAVLVLAILVGYWIAVRYGIDLTLRALVWAAVLAVPLGLYNVAQGDIAYYDASLVYLIGVAAVLVLFRAVDIGFARVPFLVLSTLVVILSLRRGAMLAIAVTFVIAGVLIGRGTFRTVIAVAVGAVVAAELLAPGTIVTPVEGVVHYFTGASGQDYSVNYRRFEQTNAWMNIEGHAVWGIGPTADWTLYRTFDGAFERINGAYLHNSYLWVWLRFGLLGLGAYILFLATSALMLLRQRKSVPSVVIGASIVGLMATLATASYVTTTIRWPLVLGLFVGIALAAPGAGLATEHEPDDAPPGGAHAGYS